jgi:hypothetical protein
MPATATRSNGATSGVNDSTQGVVVGRLSSRRTSRVRGSLLSCPEPLAVAYSVRNASAPPMRAMRHAG